MNNINDKKTYFEEALKNKKHKEPVIESFKSPLIKEKKKPLDISSYITSTYVNFMNKRRNESQITKGSYDFILNDQKAMLEFLNVIFFTLK